MWKDYLFPFIKILMSNFLFCLFNLYNLETMDKIQWYVDVCIYLLYYCDCTYCLIVCTQVHDPPAAV